MKTIINSASAQNSSSSLASLACTTRVLRAGDDRREPPSRSRISHTGSCPSATQRPAGLYGCSSPPLICPPRDFPRRTNALRRRHEAGGRSVSSLMRCSRTLVYTFPKLARLSVAATLRAAAVAPRQCSLTINYFSGALRETGDPTWNRALPPFGRPGGSARGHLGTCRGALPFLLFAGRTELERDFLDVSSMSVFSFRGPRGIIVEDCSGILHEIAISYLERRKKNYLKHDEARDEAFYLNVNKRFRLHKNVRVGTR